MQIHTKSEFTVHICTCASVCVCAYVDDCVAAHVHERMCVMTRPRQGMPCSCLFHLMRQSQALIDSIYLALTLICLDAARQTASEPMESVSQLQNVFHFFLCFNKRVQTCIHSSSKRSPIHSRLHVSFMRLSVRSAWVSCYKVASVDTWIWKVAQGLFFLNVFFLITNLLGNSSFINLSRGRGNIWSICRILTPTSWTYLWPRWCNQKADINVRLSSYVVWHIWHMVSVYCFLIYYKLCIVYCIWDEILCICCCQGGDLSLKVLVS